MNAVLNYLLEASIGLCLFLAAYQLLLRHETNFRLNRIFLLIAVGASVTFPLIELKTPDSPVPSLSFTVELPAEQVNYVPENPTATPAPTTSSVVWKVIFIFYGVGLVLFSGLFLRRLFNMLKILKRSPVVRFNNHHLIEMSGNHSPFSFFNYIFIGNSSPLSEHEKKQIIEHERIHAKLYHSIDIILLNILGIVFWFNPLIQVYKKIFTQLHEFEADARAVESHDVDEYCSLVAKVALNSADFRLANHFSNSLTLKRIEMMRTLKQKIKGWKLITASIVIPVFFFVAACQDQAGEQQYKETEVIETPIEYPAKVVSTLNKLKKERPNDRFVVLPPHIGKLEDLKPDGRETLVDGSTIYTIDALTVVDTDETDSHGNPLRYIILHYMTDPTHNKSAGEVPQEVEVPGSDAVFLTVDQPPTYKGGMESISQFLNENIRYPEVARINNTEGSVFISFIVEPDGSIAEPTIIKGISRECDLEALRAVKLLTQWNPGMHNGKTVRVRFVLPVKFKL